MVEERDGSRPLEIWTIGHSTRSWDDFLALLQENRIEAIADVRRYPGSRAYPHFNAEPLARSLAERGIEYLPFAGLGGRRKPDPGSPNTVWRHPAFRAYADFMATPEFRAGLERLLAAARKRRTAVMCSEAVWWRCHRALISDALKAQGIRILHILDSGKVVEHPYTSAARVVGGKLHYGAGSGR